MKTAERELDLTFSSTSHVVRESLEEAGHADTSE